MTAGAKHTKLVSCISVVSWSLFYLRRWWPHPERRTGTDDAKCLIKRAISHSGARNCWLEPFFRRSRLQFLFAPTGALLAGLRLCTQR